MITFVLKVVPPGHDLPNDIHLKIGDELSISLTTTGEVEMRSHYFYKAHVPVTIKLEHFDVLYPEGYSGAEVVFEKNSTAP